MQQHDIIQGVFYI